MNRTALFMGILLSLTSLASCSESKMQEVIQAEEPKKFSFEYQGGFRIKAGTFGDSRATNGQGTIALSESGKSIYIVGHLQTQAIAEFEIPELVNSGNVLDLPISEPIQNFSEVLTRVPTGNEQNINRLTGMEVIDGELFVNGLDHYDGGSDNTNTTLIIRDPSNLAESKVSGFFDIHGAAHGAGWMSQLPEKWASIFGASYVYGYASNYAISSRLSMGPSAFVYYLDNFSNTNEESGTIPGQTLLDYSLDNPLEEDVFNESLANDLWTHMSFAVYGFVIPGTDLYYVIGYSAGHESGVAYKYQYEDGFSCPGYCPKDRSDIYNYFWIWDLNDLHKVAKGELAPHEPRPVEHGEFSTLFTPDQDMNIITGADFNFETNQLYVLLSKADSEQNKFESAPVVLVFNLDN